MGRGGGGIWQNVLSLVLIYVFDDHRNIGHKGKGVVIIILNEFTCKHKIQH